MMPALSILALTTTETGVGVVALIAGMISYHFTIGHYIRQQAGIKETTSTELTGQPIEVKVSPRFVTQPELEKQLEHYASTTEMAAMERRLSDKLEEDFRKLDEKRSRSIGNLHEHLSGTTKNLTEKIEQTSSRQHDRIEAMSVTLRGEFESKLSEVRGDITDLPGRVIALLQQTGQIGRGGKA